MKAASSVKWYKSKRIWSQILSALAGALLAIDSAFGTNIMTNEITGLVVTLLGTFGVSFTMGSTRKVVK